MTNRPAQWTRRQFSQLLAASAAVSFLGRHAKASTSSDWKGFAYIASSANNGTIHAFRISASIWQPIQSIPAPSPAHLEQHPTLPILYAIHNVALWYNLPRGAVSAYRIAPDTGLLTLLNTQPLSLAATNPRHAAVSLNGTAIAVAAPAAGIFNILPIALDGTLQPPAIIRKDLSLNTPETHSIVFLPDNKTLLTADSRHHPLHSFTIEENFLIPTPIDPSQTQLQPRPESILIPPSIASPTSLVFRPA